MILPFLIPSTVALFIYSVVASASDVNRDRNYSLIGHMISSTLPFQLPEVSSATSRDNHLVSRKRKREDQEPETVSGSPRVNSTPKNKKNLNFHVVTAENIKSRRKLFEFKVAGLKFHKVIIPSEYNHKTKRRRVSKKPPIIENPPLSVLRPEETGIVDATVQEVPNRLDQKFYPIDNMYGLQNEADDAQLVDDDLYEHAVEQYQNALSILEDFESEHEDTAQSLDDTIPARIYLDMEFPMLPSDSISIVYDRAPPAPQNTGSVIPCPLTLNHH